MCISIDCRVNITQVSLLVKLQFSGGELVVCWVTFSVLLRYQHTTFSQVERVLVVV